MVIEYVGGQLHGAAEWITLTRLTSMTPDGGTLISKIAGSPRYTPRQMQLELINCA